MRGRILTAVCLPSFGLLIGGVSAQAVRFRDPVFTSVKVQRDLKYGRSYNTLKKAWEDLKLDLYEPAGDTLRERPAIVIVHGGGFRGGDKATTQFRKLATEFALRGWLAVSINYRLTRGRGPFVRAHATAAMEDFKAAVRWLRRFAKTWRVDGSRIACCGGSAGAITCLEAAYVKGEGSSGNPGYSSKVHAVGDFWGLLYDLNEMEHGEPPVFIVHGTRDPVVLYKNATALEARAKQVGVPVELHPVPGAGHGPWNAVFTTFWKDLHAFYWEHLRLDQIAGLAAPATATSPGQVTLRASGVAGDLRLVYVAAAPGSFDLGALGTFGLALNGLIVLPATPMPKTPRQPSVQDRLVLPAGLRGLKLHAQDLRMRPTVLRTLSNTVRVDVR